MDEPPAKKLRPSPPASTPPPHVLLQHWRGEKHKMSSKQLSFCFRAYSRFKIHVGQNSDGPKACGKILASKDSYLEVVLAHVT